MEGENCVAEAVSSDSNDNNNDEFGSLASRLFNTATDANAVVNNTTNMADAPIPSTDLWLHRRHPTRTQICLKNLFDYQNANNNLDLYHTAAEKNLQTLAETFEQMFAKQEGNKTLEIPTVTPHTSPSVN